MLAKLSRLLPIRIKTFLKYYEQRLMLFLKFFKLPNWKLMYLDDSSYVADGFATTHDPLFLKNDKLVNSYHKSIKELKDFYVKPNSKYYKLHWESQEEIIWRAHIVTWAAKTVEKVPGDFVECGVANGLLSKTICEYVDFKNQNRNFYLLDCWELFREVEWGRCYPVEKNDSWFDFASERFSDYPNVKLVKGMIPESLAQVSNIDQIAYLSIDMNDGDPELAALKFFWDKLSPGAIVYFDDFLWGYKKLQDNIAEFLSDKNVELLHIPTGNSILIKN